MTTIPEDVRVAVDHVALRHFDAWSKRPNRAAYVADLARGVAQAVAEVVVSRTTARVLADAAGMLDRDALGYDDSTATADERNVAHGLRRASALLRTRPDLTAEEPTR